MAASDEDYKASICTSQSTEVANCVRHTTTFLARCHLTQCVKIWNLGFVAQRIEQLQRVQDQVHAVLTSCLTALNHYYDLFLEEDLSRGGQ